MRRHIEAGGENEAKEKLDGGDAARAATETEREDEGAGENVSLDVDASGVGVTRESGDEEAGATRGGEREEKRGDGSCPNRGDGEGRGEQERKSFEEAELVDDEQIEDVSAVIELSLPTLRERSTLEGADQDDNREEREPEEEEEDDTADEVETGASPLLLAR